MNTTVKTVKEFCENTHSFRELARQGIGCEKKERIKEIIHNKTYNYNFEYYGYDGKKRNGFIISSNDFGYFVEDEEAYLSRYFFLYRE